jgi:hypothetical protein
MDSGFRSPLVDMFRRGEAARDACLLAAQGTLAPRAHEQISLLMLLADHPDAEIAKQANATLDGLAKEALSAFLARTDATDEMRTFFKARGIEPAATPATSAAEPLFDPESDTSTGGAADGESEEDNAKLVSTLPVKDRLKLAMKGSREQRAQLIRDPNKIVSTAVLASPKVTDAEIEAFTKMGNVSEDVLRIISMNRTWTKSYAVVLGLAKNPKTPPAISMQMMNRLTEKDVKFLSIDRNVPEVLRLAARRMLVKSKHG